MTNDQRYPALLNDRLTPVYDLFVKLFFPERHIKRELIAHARLAPGQRVLDVGAGTGTLAIMIKQAQPAAQVTGLDSDPQILAIAREKASQAGAQVTFDLGNATALPYPARSFERVVSSLVFSLLSSADKKRALQEAYRVLSNGGQLHITDFGPPHTAWGRRLAPLQRRFEPITGNLDGLLPDLFRETGFENVQEEGRYATVLGTLCVLKGQKST